MEIFASENKRSFVRRFDSEGNNFWSDLMASCVKWPRDPISRETRRADFCVRGRKLGGHTFEVFDIWLRIYYPGNYEVQSIREY